MQLNINRQILHDGKIFAHLEGLGFSGFVPSPVQPKVLKPFLDWTGGKIPIQVWQTVLSWFRAHPDNEVQVRMYYNPDTREWRPWAFPQEYPSGMTTKELPEHQHTAEDAVQFGEPWIRLGSVHHHCSMAAFQSQTDHADEATVPGLHITMGKLREPTWDIHSRVSMRLPGRMEGNTLLYGPTQCFFDAVLDQWFQLPEVVAQHLPAPLHGAFIKALITTPPDAAIYPPRWDANLAKRVYTHQGNGQHQPRQHPNGGSEDKRLAPTGPSSKQWETITPQKLDLINGMIEVYLDNTGAFRCQTVETYGWQKAGFANLIAVEGILRSCGLMQLCKFVWCFPQDKQVCEDVQHEIATKEAQLEIQRMEAEASTHGLGE